MKRKGTVLDEQPDKKKSAVSAASTSNGEEQSSVTMGSDFTDLTDDLLVQVYFFLDFKNRQVTRRVCRKLAEFVDKSTPGAEELAINVETMPERNKPMFLYDSEKVMLIVEPPRRGEETLFMFRTRLPVLRSIRPKKLRFCIDEARLFAILLQHLVEHQVARLVANIELFQSTNLGSLTDLQQACSNFDQCSQSGVQSLSLRGCPSLWSLPLYFPRLVSLDAGNLQLTVEGLRHLSGHSSLRELRIWPPLSNTYLIQLRKMNTLATFASLQKLEHPFVFPNSAATRQSSFEAFGSMLSGMTSLDCLGTLYKPFPELWEHLKEQNIVSHSLKILKIGLHHATFPPTPTCDGLLAMVKALPGLAPSLSTLHLRCLFFESDRESSVEAFVHALTGLRQHPNLEKLELAALSFDRDKLSGIRQGLGNAIEVVFV